MHTLKLSAWQDLPALYTHILELQKTGPVILSGKHLKKNLSKDQFKIVVEEILQSNDMPKGMYDDYIEQLKDVY